MTPSKPTQLRRQALERATEIVAHLNLPAGTSLAATGSFAREEMTPHSDLDLILLCPEAVVVDESLWYPVWDSPLRLDASIRTPEECAAMVTQDDRAALALLELTHISGDELLTDQARSGVLNAFRRTLPGRFDEFASTAVARWHRSGSLVTMTRPDLKHGRGGLRDLELLNALALGNLTDAPDLKEQRRLLADIRVLLHHAARRSRDILDPEFAADIALELGFADRHALFSALVSAATEVDNAVTRALDNARSLSRRRIRRGTSIPLALDVVDRDGYVSLSRTPNLADPALLTRAAAAAARYGLPFHPTTLSAMRGLPEFPDRLPAAAARDVFALLASAEHSPRVINELDREGLWSRIIPEWDSVRGRMPAEPSHIHTIDQHSLVTVAGCAAKRTEVARPDLLLLTALYHDLGKGQDRPHEEVGAEMVAGAARRLGLNLLDTERVVTSVREHTTLAKLAARHDPYSDEALTQFLSACKYDSLTVELLSTLSLVDAASTGPGVLTRSLAHAVHVLGERARAALSPTTFAAPSISAPEPLGIRRGEAGHLTVYWQGAHHKDVHRLIAVFIAKAWELNSLRMKRTDSGVIAECDVMPTTQTLEQALDAPALVQSYKSKVHTGFPQPQPGACVVRWHLPRVLEVRTDDRRAVIGAVLNAVENPEWVTASSPGGTSVIRLSFADDVDRTQVERNVTSALGSR
ncbi:[protein-PII] uridylyltransferase [Corynebacterium tapiri]|uniref:[protein-PII] uridylyltransferase n=1 Tax=Corynebacterium tapiri TaxID=1448266 RepID=A0A5C4U568_9CORY|nr:[protein-PII] uridylyltransferase [Corynebacterium tapiri]TNL99319.1 [protein-PII] uridylyltransferase [Corynebacterium tapiri]